MVHDFKPPFLDGRTQYSTQMGAIQVVKDQNSDMAILAKKGSVVVKDFRERTEKLKTK
jgi:pre-mRNA-splicing factor ATP-dependent RNA helicase DHX38/PRP16